MFKRALIMTAGVPALLFAAVLPSAAQVDPDNVKTCEDAGLDGALLLSEDSEKSAENDIVRGTVTEKKYLTVTLLDDSYEITGVVVKGGPGFNVYTSSPFTNLVAPDNPGGQTPEISHWFVCGEQVTTPTPEPSDTKTPEPTDTPGPTKSAEPTKTAAPVPTSVPAGTTGSSTGGGAWILLGLVAAGMAAGAGMVVTRRRSLTEV